MENSLKCQSSLHMAVASRIAKWQILLQGRRIMFPWRITLQALRCFSSRKGNGMFCKNLLQSHNKIVSGTGEFLPSSFSLFLVIELHNTHKCTFFFSPPSLPKNPIPLVWNPSTIAWKEQVQFYSHLNYKAIIIREFRIFMKKESFVRRQEFSQLKTGISNWLRLPTLQFQNTQKVKKIRDLENKYTCRLLNPVEQRILLDLWMQSETSFTLF